MSRHPGQTTIEAAPNDAELIRYWAGLGWARDRMASVAGL